MRFSLSSALAILALTTPAVLAGDPGTVAYDTTYDNTGQSTLGLACSDGVNGLYTKGYQTLGSLPNFPFVGSAPTIPGWNSPNCGKCYKIYYKSAAPGSVGKAIYVTGVDASRASGGFTLSKAAMDALTGGQAEMLGRVNVSWVEAAPSDCGFNTAKTRRGRTERV